MAKPKLALIPATQGSKLYSVLPADGVGDFTFSRGSAATRINKDGLIETVASGVSRLNYPLIDGVVNGCPSHLLEPTRSNLIPYSEDFSQTTWQKQSAGVASAPIVTSNYAISPDGTLNADRVIFDINGGTTSSDFSQLTDPVSTNIGDVTSSIWIKSNTSSNYNMSFVDPTGNYVSIVVTTEWQRFYVTSTTVSSTSSIKLRLRGNESTSDYADMSLWGAQLEQGSYATSYIPTSGSSVTRVAETANGAGDASTFNDSEGVLMAEISALADLDDTRYITLNAGTSDVNRLSIQYRNSGELRLYNGGTSTAQMIHRDTSLDLAEKIKIAIKYGTTSSSYKVYINGFSKTIESAFVATNMSGLDNLKFTDANGSGSPFYGSTKQLQYFDSALNDSDLEKITSWTSFTDLANGQLYSIK